MPFQVITIKINPTTTRFYTHSISPNELEITIAGEDPQLDVKRPRSLMPNNLPDPNSPAELSVRLYPFANAIQPGD